MRFHKLLILTYIFSTLSVASASDNTALQAARLELMSGPPPSSLTDAVNEAMGLHARSIYLYESALAELAAMPFDERSKADIQAKIKINQEKVGPISIEIEEIERKCKGLSKDNQDLLDKGGYAELSNKSKIEELEKIIEAMRAELK